jgi:hypothetical protein
MGVSKPSSLSVAAATQVRVEFHRDPGHAGRAQGPIQYFVDLLLAIAIEVLLSCANHLLPRTNCRHEGNPPMDNQSFTYSTHMRGVGIAYLWLSFGFILSACLICIGFKPTMDVDSLFRGLLTVSFTCSGILFLRTGARYLWGHLLVDEQGIRIRPMAFGWSFRWSELKRWRIAVLEGGGEGETVFIEMNLWSSRWPRRWDASFTSKPDFERLVQQMRRYAPDRESIVEIV